MFTHPLKPSEKTEALRDVSFHVEKGEIFGFLGPNGAGKTTLLKILSCLVLPTRGQAKVNGHDTRNERSVKGSIGLVTSDERSFYWRLSGTENMKFFAKLYNIPGDRIKGRVQELIGRMELNDVAGRPFMSYSSGMKQKLAIARALLHNPPILFMDEPTRSLDPQSAMHIRQFIKKELNGLEGKTILLATHNLREAEILCDRMAVMSGGIIKETGTVERIRRIGLTGWIYSIEVQGLPDEARKMFKITAERKTMNGNTIIEVSLGKQGDLHLLLKAIMEGGGRIISCDRMEPDLEDSFSRIIEEKNSGKAADG